VFSLITVEGFDAFQRNLKNLPQKSKSLEGQQSISFDVLFNNSFMRKHTSANNFQEFLDTGGFTLHALEYFSNMPDDVFDEYVRKESRFANWQSMIEEATGEYVAEQLGF
jgi:hypothetical protein